MEEHNHVHEHNHEHVSDIEKLTKLLEYLKDHNEHHAHEILHLSEDALELGKSEVSEILLKASRVFDEGNALLIDAINKL